MASSVYNSSFLKIDGSGFRMDAGCAREALLQRVMDKEHFAKLAVDAVMRLKGSTNVESIQITKKPGTSLIDSFLDKGFIGEELLKNKELPTSFTVRNVIKAGKRRLFIGGPLKLTLEEFEEFVRCFHTDGPVTKASMPYNPFVGLSSGYGNVSFTLEAVADEVVDQESFELNGITIDVKTNLQKSLPGHTESGSRASSTFDARMDANRFLQPQTVDDVNYAKIGAVSADKVPFQGRMAFGLFERDGGSEVPSHTANSGGYCGFCKDEGKSDGRREKRKKSELPDEFVQAQKIRAKLFGVNPRRSFTLEEFTEYNEKINMSGGFDIGNAPLDIDFQLMYLRPVQLSPDGLWTLNKVEDFSKLALDKYNEDLQKKYEFVKFLKANYSSSIQALELYLTFEAEDTTKDVPVKTFQAHISRLFGGNAEVKFCRTA